MRSLKSVFGLVSALAVIALVLAARAEAFSGLGTVRGFIASFMGRSFAYEELVRLRAENEALRAERSTLLEAGIPPFSYNLRRAPVHSRYPFGAQGLFTVAAGSEQGVQEGMPVLAAPGALIGKVTKVTRTQSEVITVWNSAWRSSARFERGEAKALIAGGATPQVTLIPRNQELAGGVRVLSDDPAFPYGLFLGATGELSEEEDSPWFSAPLTLPYAESDMREVLILVDFP